MLTVLPSLNCQMNAKAGGLLHDSKQLWRHEASGVLRSKAHRGKCLGLETHTTGGTVMLQVVVNLTGVTCKGSTNDVAASSYEQPRVTKGPHWKTLDSKK